MVNMKSRKKWILAFSLSVALLFGIKSANSLAQAPGGDNATAVFSGGCFWGVDAVFKHVKGVDKVVSGYAGGAANTAQYETVSTGTTGHAESVQVTYDPSKVSYDDLLKVFFFVAHDPTELNRQGPDEGTQYRSSIFYENAAQKKMADDYIAQLDQKHAFSKPIVTKVVPLTRVLSRPKPIIRTTWSCIQISPTSSSTICRNWSSFRKTYRGYTSNRSRSRSAGHGAAELDLAHLVGARAGLVRPRVRQSPRHGRARGRRRTRRQRPGLVLHPCSASTLDRSRSFFATVPAARRTTCRAGRSLDVSRVRRTKKLKHVLARYPGRRCVRGLRRRMPPCSGCTCSKA